LARINIEDCWWIDPRRERLGNLLGSILTADAIMIRAWRLAQEFWGNNRGLIPKHIFESLEAYDKIIQANLAEEREGGIYVRGSSQWLDWVIEEREKRIAGGKRSAEVRRAKYGSAVPFGASNSEQETELPAERPPNKPNKTEVSGSGSGSGSKNNNYPREEISNSTKSDLAVVQLPNQSEVFENQFDGDGLEAVAEVMRQAFDGDPPRHVARKHAQILSYFVDAESFAEWTHDVINAKNCPDPAKDPPGFRSYYLATLSKTLRGEA
jgi:hypothetical protein